MFAWQAVRMISTQKVPEHADYFPFRYPPFYVASLAAFALRALVRRAGK